ncbi:uncharacterized protein RCC_06120 [Ramularia collo-cygni]|uniref:Uncharacterized protein n=1 Tax=Ramularia collo-cygni TaxID=112498 RepID=A0A2D3USF7_9PEZI|nr:uncharacterized protein RCC_06120 [Ramularia collo-cygni]CZT20262.1 uncharacterized protein RCC_06120 [Ramularia collo-cygni]
MANCSGKQASDELDNRIQSLCQEIQDMILETFLEAQIPCAVVLTNGYKSPVGLQLNRKIRGKFAKKYYGRTTFEIFGIVNKYDFHPAGLKIGRIDRKHLPLMRHLEATYIHQEKWYQNLLPGYEQFIVTLIQLELCEALEDYAGENLKHLDVVVGHMSVASDDRRMFDSKGVFLKERSSPGGRP